MVVVALAAASAGAVVVSSRADAVPVPWRNCGSAGDPLIVTKFDAAVWPPQSGRTDVFNMTFAVTHDFDVSTDVLTITPSSADKLKVPIKTLLAPLLAHHFQAGPHNTGLRSFTVPGSIASGTVFSVHLDVLGRAGNQDFCLDMTMPIK